MYRSYIVIKITTQSTLVKFTMFFGHFGVKNGTFGAKPLYVEHPPGDFS